MGLPGSGKSYLSEHLTQMIDGIWLDRYFKGNIDIDARTIEGAPVIQVEADTSVEMDFIDQIGLTEEQTELKSRLRRDLGLDVKMMDKVRAAVVKTFGTKLPNIESKEFYNWRET